MLDEVKLALRVTTTVFDSELNALISAAMNDLSRSGIEDDNTELYKVAVITFVRSYFGNYDDKGRFAEAYQNLKAFLSLTAESKKNE